MRTFFKMVLLIIIVFATLEDAAQNNNRLVYGTVLSSEERMPLEGVSVWAKVSNHYSGSQADGAYYINVSPVDSVLVFSLNEYETREIKIGSSLEYDITLDRKNSFPDIVIADPFSPFGKWKGIFRLKDGVEVPFIFDITGKDAGSSKIFFLNAEERFDGGEVKWTDDSLFVYLNQFDNELAFKIKNNLLHGVLRRQDKTGPSISVTAESGAFSRFKETGIAPVADISGTYDILLKDENGKDEKAVGLFTQSGNKLKATFLRITGDSRYLEGIVSGRDFYLSSFIGSWPVYYKGTIHNDGHITGEIIGARGSQKFTGSINEEASLPDPYKLTYLKNGYKSLDFSFPDPQGNPVSLKDAKYKNKVVILTITGTWCPNCIDEATFLSPWYKENKKRGVEVLAIHYERKADTAYARKAIHRFHEKYGIEYDAVIAGVADKQYVAESLPALNTFLSFPTIIFIDKQGNVSKIYTGYTGPATGKHYDNFVKEFNEEIDRLLTQ